MPVDVLRSPYPIGTPGVAADIAKRLLDHYDRTARRLPWRAPPGTNRADPYRVWLSEIMLQQTTVAAVIPYFERFTTRWPTVEALAAARDEDVMAAWAGLGYYARARNLLACARMVTVAHGGAFPEEEAELACLPGIGPYTAAAIAAIAFGRHAVAVDANVERVVARLFAIDTPLPAARTAIRAAAATIVPAARAGDFAQAMMDLGSAICTARAPDCGICPLAEECGGLASGDPARLPVKAAKAAKPLRRGTAWWIESDAGVWLIRRPARGLLGGMRALPSTDWTPNGGAAPPFAADWRPVGSVAHVFTHFRLDLTVMATRLTAGTTPSEALGDGGQWWPLAQLEAAGLPTLFARAAALATEARLL